MSSIENGDDARWIAVRTNDVAADGHFVYAVRTTGIYCRPSCRSRQPRRANVVYFDTPDQAKAAGYRACKRCRPHGDAGAPRHEAAVAEACRLIERADTEPALDELADAVGISRFHFHRLFRRVTGVTPKSYARAVRTERLRVHLDEGHTMTDAIHAAGFGSSSRFYADAAAYLGMSAAEYRRGGERIVLRVAVTDCSLGKLLVAASGRGVCDIRFGDESDTLLCELKTRFPNAEYVDRDPQFEQQVARVVSMVEAPARSSSLPLDIRGTAFQRRVWDALRAIPAGKTLTYSEVAERIGAPGSARAVAGACAANRLAVAIPCHRVIRHDGSLSGYRWGEDRKRVLLERETRDIDSDTERSPS